MTTPAVPAARSREQGQVLVIFMLALVALLAAAGLAIDMGRFYAERRFLQNAADAAALAAGTALVQGASQDEARATARAVLGDNYGVPPNGIRPSLPPESGSEVYQAGHAGSPSYLIDGILFSGGSVRVAVRNTIPYTFGRAVGLDSNMIIAQARVGFEGTLLPIAVRQYINGPGTGAGTSPCVDNRNTFMAFFATAATSCLGTDSDGGARQAPNPGAAYDASNPDSDRTNHGPVVEILGQGADPNNAADFRGFVALDIRNFQSSSSQLYYNGVSASTNANTLKSMEAQWILDGGYPGPMFPPVVTPPDPNDQVAAMPGNSTGIAVDALQQRFAPGDEILVAVYPGVTMQIPDFSMSTPGTVSVSASGHTASVGSFRVSRNQAFSGQVVLSTLPDLGDPAHPLVLGTMLNPATPLTYSPNPVTPSMGSGTSVVMQDAQMSGAAAGIYTLWLKGQAGSPYLTTKYIPFGLKVGTVGRDFTVKVTTSEVAVAPGGTAAFELQVAKSGAAFGGTGVTLSLEALPGNALPAGLGAASFSPANVAPGNGQGNTSSLAINAGTLTPGLYPMVVRATGTNGDGQTVTHLLTIQLDVGTTGSSGNQEYVDISGFAVMRIAGESSNGVSAYAITPVIPDLQDSRLRRGQVARLKPWS